MRCGNTDWGKHIVSSFLLTCHTDVDENSVIQVLPVDILPSLPAHPLRHGNPCRVVAGKEGQPGLLPCEESPHKDTKHEGGVSSLTVQVASRMYALERDSASDPAQLSTLSIFFGRKRSWPATYSRRSSNVSSPSMGNIFRVQVIFQIISRPLEYTTHRAPP